MIIYYNHDFEGGRKESHRLLAAAFSRHTGGRMLTSDLEDRMRTGEFGKPFIQGLDNFSISHSNRTWAVLISERPCGLDIQYPRACREDEISRRYYRDEDKSSDFFTIWTRREALVKAAGTSVAGSDIPPVSCNRILYKGDLWRVEDIVIPGADDMRAAICIAESETGVLSFRELG